MSKRELFWRMIACQTHLFSKFCEQMLEGYRTDKRVMCISGDNFLPRNMQKKNGYYFQNMRIFGGGLAGDEHGKDMMWK